MENLTKAERLKNELDALRPLDAEAEARIMQKFRLDWNYHSNNLEGNSLTYGETKALILFGITAQGKPLKDHFEITGHNEAINWILEIVKGETVLTESFIRQLHTLLLKETSYKTAQTADGNPTRRKIEVGKYKTQPNHVVTVTGETFYFATPEETPAQMHELIEWFRREKEKLEVNPIILAALFHYRFIRIHPFDDGNGRVARILMNFILMQFGYPPVIIKTEDKENYYAVLRLADADQLEPFIEYITENLIRSLEIMIRGAKGESIEEPDDLDKELSLLERKFIHTNKTDEKIWSKKNLSEILVDLIPKLIKEFIFSSRKFDRFYLDSSFSIKFVTQSQKTLEDKEIKVFEKTKAELLKKDLDSVSKLAIFPILEKLENIQIPDIISLRIQFNFYTLLTSVIGNEFSSEIDIEFDRTNYSIVLCDSEHINSKTYSTTFSDNEILNIVKLLAIQHKEKLEELLTEQTSL